VKIASVFQIAISLIETETNHEFLV